MNQEDFLEKEHKLHIQQAKEYSRYLKDSLAVQKRQVVAQEKTVKLLEKTVKEVLNQAKGIDK